MTDAVEALRIGVMEFGVCFGGGGGERESFGKAVWAVWCFILRWFNGRSLMRVGLGSAPRPALSFLCHHMHTTAAIILYTTFSMFLRVFYFTSDSF